MEHLTEKQLRSLLQAPACKRLLELLQSEDGAVLRQAVRAAGSGDHSAVERLLQEVPNRDELQSLAQTLSRQLG